MNKHLNLKFTKYITKINKLIKLVIKKYKLYFRKISKHISRYFNNSDTCIYNDNILVNTEYDKELIKYNIDKFRHLDMESLLRTMYITNVPQCLGTLYTDDRKRYTVYLYTKAKEENRINIKGIGRGINLDILKNLNITWQVSGEKKKGCIYAYFYHK